MFFRLAGVDFVLSSALGSSQLHYSLDVARVREPFPKEASSRKIC